MHFFIAKLVFQIQHETQLNHSQFEEIICLIKAQGYPDAFENAELIGNSREVQFRNSHGSLVNWIFVGIGHLEFAGNLDHGNEVFSYIRIQENDADYAHYIRTMHQNIKSGHFIEEITL